MTTVNKVNGLLKYKKCRLIHRASLFKRVYYLFTRLQAKCSAVYVLVVLFCCFVCWGPLAD